MSNSVPAKTRAEMMEEINRVCERSEPSPGVLEARSEELAAGAKEFGRLRDEEKRRDSWAGWLRDELGRAWTWLTGRGGQSRLAAHTTRAAFDVCLHTKRDINETHCDSLIGGLKVQQ